MLADNLEVVEAVLHLHVRGPLPQPQPQSSSSSEQRLRHQHGHKSTAATATASASSSSTSAAAAGSLPLRITVSSRVLAAPRNYTRIEAEFEGALPTAGGRGRTVPLNVTALVREWMRHQRQPPEQQPEQQPRQTRTADGGESEAQQPQQQQLVVKTDEPWMRDALSLEPDTENVSVCVWDGDGCIRGIVGFADTSG